jgi:hypothetical protein
MPALDATQAARLSAGTLLLLPLLPPPLLLYGDDSDSTGESKAAVPALPVPCCGTTGLLETGSATSASALANLQRLTAKDCTSLKASLGHPISLQLAKSRAVPAKAILLLPRLRAIMSQPSLQNVAY